MNNYQNDIISFLKTLISYDSSQTPPEAGMPFGKGAADCLNAFLSHAQAMGFETHNYDNFAGEVIFGEGEEIAVLCHLDVVPAGSGWMHQSFGGEI